MNEKEIRDIVSAVVEGMPVKSLSIKENISISVSLLALIVNVGMVFYFGGRLDQRVVSVEKFTDENRAAIKENAIANSRQDVAIASQQVQYGQISNQLGRVEIAVSGQRR